ncbi:cubilin [Euwallacea fornicatus]|uniref:cubilin n=1 Tax=Euwallacea fornicatus TaxID=995702 RepID=UPI00338DC04F
MQQFCWLHLVGVFLSIFLASLADTQPKLYVEDNNLHIKLGNDKLLHFEAAKIQFNDVDAVATLLSMQQSIKLFQTCQIHISQIDSKMNAMESRLLTGGLINGSNISYNTTGNRVIMMKIRLINRKLAMMNRRITTIEELLIKDECASNPCNHGAACLDIYNGFICQCPKGWEGNTCDIDINECTRFIGTDLGCLNGGTCQNLPGSYQCQCTNGWTGIHCHRKPTDCSSGGSEICGHGTCIPQNNQYGFKCLCDSGWTNDSPTKPCTTDVDECAQKHPPCSTNPLVQCINVPGSYMCQHCPPGYTGNGYYCVDINECELFNGGCSVAPYVECINTPGSKKCGPCPVGYVGDGKTCTYQGVCHVNNGGCSQFATCVNNPAIGETYVQCVCMEGYTGSGIGPTGCRKDPFSLSGACASNPCVHGTCVSNNSTKGFICVCKEQYSGMLCNKKIDPCSPNPCLNGGTCTAQRRWFFCSCIKSYSGRICQNQKQACMEHINQTNGTVRYPPDDYDVERIGDLNCAWRISTDDDKVLEISFTKFIFIDTAPCSTQFLEIHDGPTLLAPVYGRFCGTVLPGNGTLITTRNSIYLWVRSTISRLPSLELSWVSKAPECGGKLDSESGLISSPGYPHSYPNNRDCYWTFEVPLTKRLLFHIYTLNIGNNTDCSKDYVEFIIETSSRPIFAKYCNSIIPDPFYSLSSSGSIHFRSDGQDSYSGFQIGYSVVDSIPGCGGVYTTLTGYLHSVQLTEVMPSPLVCIYQIKVPANTSVKLEFTEMDIENNCDFTNVAIYVKTSSIPDLLIRHCGNTLTGPLITRGSDIIVKSLSRYRFKSQWTLSYELLCEQIYTDSSKSFTSLLTANKYCRHLIMRPPGWVISLDVEILDYDFISAELKIYDGDNENGTLLGTYYKNEKAKVVSSTNYLLIVVSFSIKSFKPPSTALIVATYRSFDLGCGGLLNNDVGTISFPPHRDEKYNGNNHCKWVIQAPPEKIVQLTWILFNLEKSIDCAYDNVKVFDNNTDNGNGYLIGKYCGNRLPPLVFSTSNVVTVTFDSDNTIHGDGFYVSYTFIKSTQICGGNYFTPAGVLKSPEFPKNYPINRECIWVITVPAGDQIMLTVKNFTIEAYSNCKYDWLEIRNGGYSSSPLIGTYCGTKIPKTIPSHANKLYLKFNSDMSRTAAGFMIEWTSATTGCGGTLMSSTGSITSPQYPEPYSKNAECIWNIFVNIGSKIKFIFSDLDLESQTNCTMDYVQFFDGPTTSSKSVGKYCTPQMDFISSTSNEMTVLFRSDVSFQGRGFHLKYFILCDNTLTGYGGIIESPNFPSEYPKDQNCNWKIVVPKGNKINISFSDFSIEETAATEHKQCNYDYIEILYGEENNYEFNDDTDDTVWTTYKRFCGQENPGIIALNSNRAMIHFVSDSILIGSGFRLEWYLNGCGGFLSNAFGSISSPNYPKPYPGEIECNWTIKLPLGEKISLSFDEINIEKVSDCMFDYIEVFNGPDETYPLMGKFCYQQTTSPVKLTSTGNNMFIHFVADNSYEGRGFSAHYNSEKNGCGGQYTLPNGFIYSPNYPNNFEKKQTCEYLITTNEHHVIALRFEDVDLLKTSNCSTNYIKVFDGPNQAYPLLKTVCGNTTIQNKTIRSSTENMFVEFSSNSYLTSKGFKAFYQQACGAIIKTGSSGIIDIQKELNIISDDEYVSTNNCSITIIAEDPTNHVTLTIQQIDTSLIWCDDENEIYAVKVYNGQFRSSPLLKEFCTTVVPPAIVSDGSALHIEVTNSVGFKAKYSVIDSECGGELTALAGFISSPGWPKRYPLNTDCTWTISMGAGHTIKLDFTKLDIPESPSCNLDFLEVREGDGTDGKLRGVFCGTQIPTAMTVIGTMQLIFRSTTIEGNTQNKGFLVQYALSNENHLSGSEGVIENQNVQLTGTYTWLINTNISTIIELSITSLGLGTYDNSCDANFLKVYDGMNDQALLLKEKCANTEEVILSTSNMLYLELQLYSQRIDIKYRIMWKELSRKSAKSVKNQTTADCQSFHKLEKKGNLTISSPGYPDGYAYNLRCEWIVEIPQQYHLTLKFVNINFGPIFYHTCNYADSVSVFTKQVNDDQWTFLKEVCNNQVPIPEVIGFNLMKVTFKSNGYLNGTGFQVYVKTDCGGTLTDSVGFIQFDKDDNKDECQWNITVKSGRTIKLTFMKFDLGSNEENACSSYLIIRNGMFRDSPFLGNGKFCGRVLPHSMESISNHLYLKYSGSKNVEGFSIKYEEVSVNCNRNIQLDSTESYTVITSPNYPNVPHAHIECIWIIRAPRGESLRIDFEERFDIAPINARCNNDYVELRDGGTDLSDLMGIECQQMPSTKYTKGNVLRIKYHTDSDEPRNGFKANVSINDCGGTFRQLTGKLDSTLYRIKLGTSCTWWIKSTWGSSVNLIFEQFDVAQKDANCTAEDVAKVKIYAVDEINRKDTEQNVFCGNLSSNTMVTLSSPTVKVVFEPKSNKDRFQLNFYGHAENCGGTLEQMSGTIQTPGYPNSRSRSINCYWNIRVPKGRRITLVVEDVDISTANTLLVIYDGVTHSTKIVDQTNIQAGKSYDSSDNSADIFYSQSFANAKRGIKITYSSEKSTICKGNLMDPRAGEIHGPETSNGYSCEYTYGKKTSNETLVLKIMISVHANKSTGVFCDYTISKLNIMLYNHNKIQLCHDTKHLYKTIRSIWKDTVVQATGESSSAINYTILYNVYPCGGILDAESGEIVSPNFPKPPNVSIECAWIIKLPTYNSRIKVNVSTFDLEDCPRNYIEIFNGPTSVSPKIGKYCKNHEVTTFNTESNNMLIEYKYERGDNDKAMGFRIFYESETDGCGGIYHNVMTANSPNFENGNYDNNQECVWDVIAEEGYMVVLKFIDRFFIEDSENCTNDFVEIFDNKGDKWISLGRKCGRMSPSPISSTSNQLRIMFRSNNNVTAKGFRVNWDFVCGATFYATETEKSIIGPSSSVSFNRYFNYMNCTYNILSKNPQGTLYLNIDYFKSQEGKINNCSTNLTVRGISTSFLKQMFCLGQNFAEPQRYKKGVIVHYTSSDPRKYINYKLTFRDESCQWNITTPSKLVYQAPYVSKGRVRWAQPRISCSWSITAPKDQIVVLIIHNLNMLGTPCLSQYVHIYDGLENVPNKRILQLCKKITESIPISSSSNSMLVRLDSSFDRFKNLDAEVYFTYGPAAGCGGRINLTETVYIHAPNNLPHMDCQWIIFTSENYKVELEFTEITVSASCQNPVRNHTYYCTCSYIEIKDGGSPFADQIAKLCSSDNNLKRTFTTSYNIAYIRLYSAVPQNNMFKLTLRSVESICGPVQLTVTRGLKELTSPNYPNPYPANLNCYWIIKNPKKNQKIMLYFEKIDIQEGSSEGTCDSDRLEIKEDPNSAIVNQGFGPNARHMLGALTDKQDSFFFCDNDTVSFDYYSIGSEIILTFKSYQSFRKKGAGFKIKYGNSDCNRTIRADEGRIQREYNDFTEVFCSTTIIASPNTTLSIYFMHFMFIKKNEQNCTRSSLEVRENSLTGPQIFKACGYRIPSPIFSNSSKLVVNIYNSLGNTNYFKYNLIFMSSTKGIGCGGKLFNYVGIFSSPMYPKPYRKDMECTWEVRVPRGYYVAFMFKDFNIGGECTQNKVLVTTYTNFLPTTMIYCSGDSHINVLFSEIKLEVTYYSSVNNGGTGWLAQFQAIKHQNEFINWYG